MSFNPDIHHRRSIRLRNYDYSNEGAYFVTICTWKRECLFGDIREGSMRLNDLGTVIFSSWNNLTNHYRYIELDEFVVMPNHVHGILFIVGAAFMTPDCATDAAQPFVVDRGAMNQGAMNQGAMNRAPTVGEIVRGFKARCTIGINKLRQTPGYPVWQRDFFERVIRNEHELARIRDYISSNPMKWEFDKNHPSNHNDA